MKQLLLDIRKSRHISRLKLNKRNTNSLCSNVIFITFEHNIALITILSKLIYCLQNGLCENRKRKRVYSELEKSVVIA